MSDPDVMQKKLMQWEGGDLDAQRPEGDSAPAWMLSLADLVSLLLTFFVLLFSMTGVREDQWQDVVDALSTRLNPPIVTSESVPVAERNISRDMRRHALGLPYLATLFESIFAESPDMKNARVTLLPDRLILSLPNDQIFDGEGTKVSAPARELLSSVAGVLNGLTNEIGVSAHTSPMPEGGPSYQSNWEFSMARAASVANILTETGVTKPFRVYGMAHARFNDLPNVPPAERFALARRVDIVILPSWRKNQ